MTGCWRVVAPELLNWRELDGEWLLHDAGSARIHLIDGFTAAVMSTLETEAATADQIAVRLSSESGEAVSPQAVSDAICQLAAVDLVQPVQQP